MSTYTRITYQIVFATRNRIAALEKIHRDELFMHIAGILKNKKCHNLAVNGVADHVHVLCELHPTIALADLVKDIKLGTTDMINRNRMFPAFPGWQEGYGAFTYTRDDREKLIHYVRNQEAHHQTEDFIKEYICACLMKRRSITTCNTYPDKNKNPGSMCSGIFQFYFFRS